MNTDSIMEFKISEISKDILNLTNANNIEEVEPILNQLKTEISRLLIENNMSTETKNLCFYFVYNNMDDFLFNYQINKDLKLQIQEDILKKYYKGRFLRIAEDFNKEKGILFNEWISFFKYNEVLESVKSI